VQVLGGRDAARHLPVELEQLVVDEVGPEQRKKVLEAAVGHVGGVEGGQPEQHLSQASPRPALAGDEPYLLADGPDRTRPQQRSGQHVRGQPQRHDQRQADVGGAEESVRVAQR
jgi:hypothetical protein